MATPKPQKLFFIFAILSALYLLSQFFRVSNAVIAPDLMRDLRLNAETLGILGGAFFYSFALLQIPMGPLLDRVGPRIVVRSLSHGDQGLFSCSDREYAHPGGCWIDYRGSCCRTAF